VIIATASTAHFRLSESKRFEIESRGGKNEKSEQFETTLPSHVKIIDEVQIAIIDASEFKLTPSEMHINGSKTKFVMVNSSVGEHEMVVRGF